MSRLGRNPFEKKVEKKRLRAIDIVTGPEEPASAPNTASSSKKPIAQAAGLCEKLATFLAVDVPAESYVFGLKMVLLTLSIFD